MTDETFNRIVEHVKRYSMPPNPLFPNGLNIDVVVDSSLQPDDIRLGSFGYSSPIRLCEADFIDLSKRLHDVPPWGQL